MGFGSQGDSCSESGSDDSSCSGFCHAEHIVQVLNSFRQSSIFTDVVLQVEGREFPCHRAALCAASRYFRTMFMGRMREEHQRAVSLEAVSAAAMEHLLDFIYVGRVQLREESVVVVFQAADLLDVPELSRLCAEFLERCVRHANCLSLLDFAVLYSLQPLLQRCQRLLWQDFTAVSRHEEFLDLPAERVHELLDSEKLQATEEELVEAVLLWAQRLPGQRVVPLAQLLGRLRLPLLDPVFFTDVLEADDLVQECRDCWVLLQEARQYRVYGREISSERTRPRRRSGWAEMIVVIGGHYRSGISWASLTEKLDPTSGKWLPSATVPGYGKCEFAVCELQNHIYLSGGQLNSSDVWRLVPQLDQWVRVGSMKTGRWRHMMTCLRGKLYAVGGYNGHQRLSSVECYSVFENVWKPVAPLLLAVSSAALASCAGKLYVIDGATNDTCNSNKVQCYDPVKDEWTFVSSCPFSQRCIDAVSLNGSIYVAGGLLDNLYCYTPRSDAWSKVAELPIKLENCGLTVCNGKVYIVGGRDEAASPVDRMWAFDPPSGQLMEEMPLSRRLGNHGCVTVMQRLREKPSFLQE
ncbi:kelch-like protein 35 isoform X2 [Brachyhypopomus gauderio]